VKLDQVCKQREASVALSTVSSLTNLKGTKKDPTTKKTKGPKERKLLINIPEKAVPSWRESPGKSNASELEQPIRVGEWGGDWWDEKSRPLRRLHPPTG